MGQPTDGRIHTPQILRDNAGQLWAELIAAWYERAYRFACAKCGGNEDVAHEVVQEAFLVLYRACERGGIGSTAQDMWWFFAVVRNQVKMYWRRQRRIVSYDPSWNDRDCPPDQANVDYWDEVATRTRKAWRVIAQLSARDRQVVLAEIEGLPRDELLRRYGMTDTAFRQRKSRALKRIREAVLVGCA